MFFFTSDSCKSLKIHELMLVLNPLPLFVPPLTPALSGVQTVPTQAIPTIIDPPPLGGVRWVMKTNKLESSLSFVITWSPKTLEMQNVLQVKMSKVHFVSGISKLYFTPNHLQLYHHYIFQLTLCSGTYLHPRSSKSTVFERVPSQH